MSIKASITGSEGIEYAVKGKSRCRSALFTYLVNGQSKGVLDPTGLNVTSDQIQFNSVDATVFPFACTPSFVKHANKFKIGIILNGTVPKDIVLSSNVSVSSSNFLHFTFKNAILYKSEQGNEASSSLESGVGLYAAM